jgi:two-component system, sensor histidine kinase and response regulator
MSAAENPALVRPPTDAGVAEQRKILIVEDSATQSLKLRYFLEKSGYEVGLARNGLEALARLKEHVPDVIITDVAMPEMDGFELCSRVRTDERLKRLPVILLTSLSDPRDAVRGLQCGANNFIVKPYDERFLLSQIDCLLANADLRRSAAEGNDIEIFFAGQKHLVVADRMQIIDLLLSSYDAAVQKTRELQLATEKLEAQTRELERSNNELDEFGYVVSHDLQEPLRAVTGFLDLLKRRYKDQLDDKAGEFIEFAVQGAQRMQALIRDLLAYARLGAREKEFAPVDCRLVLRDALANLRAAIDESGAEVAFDEAALPVVQGSAIQLTQLFQNLIGNALKFRRPEEPPRIRVSVAPREGRCEITVADNGIGIAEGDFSRIFQVFQRLHERGKYPGTGIGLAVCKKIVERHGGEIWVESESGKGTAFHFTLRLQPAST